jgi:hypothetical protein
MTPHPARHGFPGERRNRVWRLREGCAAKGMGRALRAKFGINRGGSRRSKPAQSERGRASTANPRQQRAIWPSRREVIQASSSQFRSSEASSCRRFVVSGRNGRKRPPRSGPLALNQGSSRQLEPAKRPETPGKSGSLDRHFTRTRRTRRACGRDSRPASRLPTRRGLYYRRACGRVPASLAQRWRRLCCAPFFSCCS